MGGEGTPGWPARPVASVAAGVIVGAVQVVLAVSFAAFVFTGLVNDYLPDGIAIYGVGAAVALGVLAWRAGRRGVVGSVQDVPAAVVAVVAVTTSLDAFGGPERSFFTVVLATMVVTVVAGLVCLVLGVVRRGNVLRFVPVPVVGGILAGTGWLLIRGGVAVAVGASASLLPLSDLTPGEALVRWLPAVGFGALVLVVLRIVKRPVVVPVAIAIGLAAFVIGVVVTGSTIDEARSFGWLVLGPFDDPHVWEPWAPRAVIEADPVAIFGQGLLILAAALVVVVVTASHVSAAESVLGRDLDTNRELRDVGFTNVATGALGGIAGYHALTLTGLARRMRVDARIAGFVAASIPLAAVSFAASVIGLLPRMIAGGVLVFLGLGVVVEWVWDRRKTLARVEYIVVLLILAAFVARGFLPGVVLGVVLSVVLFAVSYSRIEPVHEVTFGESYRSNVDRPPSERAALRAMADRVEILRVNGFVFFGSTNALLEAIRTRAAAGLVRFMVLDLRRVSGVDSSAVASFVKVVRLAEAHGFELVIADTSDAVRAQLSRGGVVASEGAVSFEPDLDRALQRCEDALLRGEEPGRVPEATVEGMPGGLSSYLERESLERGSVLIRQGEAPDDVFVLESGRLRVEMATIDGERMRLRTILPGLVVGELAMYTGAARTADVVAETPAVVSRLRRSAIDQMQDERPELTAAVHRWLAETLANRLTDTQRAVEALVD
ncbi:MAG TPA: SulP family inorganic anion transporter [Actinomycetota bacterium]|nr:SulP family inorganic anion transporter [Actinomycetota bacterium]